LKPTSHQGERGTGLGEKRQNEQERSTLNLRIVPERKKGAIKHCSQKQRGSSSTVKRRGVSRGGIEVDNTIRVMRIKERKDTAGEINQKVFSKYFRGWDGSPDRKVWFGFEGKAGERNTRGALLLTKEKRGW